MRAQEHSPERSQIVLRALTTGSLPPFDRGFALYAFHHTTDAKIGAAHLVE